MAVTTHCEAWLIIADHYHARLLGCTMTPKERCRLTEYGSIESPIPNIEFGRPSPLVADMTGHSYAERHRRLEEEYRRFARQLGRWINTCIDRFGIEELTAFVPDRSHKDVLAQVRHAYRDRVTLRGENLLRLSQDKLTKHHLVTGLLHAQQQSA